PSDRTAEGTCPLAAAWGWSQEKRHALVADYAEPGGTENHHWPRTAHHALMSGGWISQSRGNSLMGKRVERRLAAVLAADVAGYSRLMGADEEGTLNRLKAVRRALVDPTIAKHRGRIVKTTGDGMLVE